MRKLQHHEIPRPAPDALGARPRHPVHVVVDNVRSIHNVGAIFRTSDAAHIAHLHLTGYTGTPKHRQLHKTALGAQDIVPWTQHAEARDVVEQLRSDGFMIAALELTDTPTEPRTVAREGFPLCLILGNEVEGVQDHLLELCDLALEIPQYGAKQSLNVAVAYGIAIFDLVRRYRSLHELPSAPRPITESSTA